MSTETRYQKNLATIDDTMRYGEMDRITLLKRILKACGAPDTKYPIIHVCGTNGKGSTGLMMANLLSTTQLKVGLFASPALNDPREMIHVDAEIMSKISFNQAFDQLCAGLSALKLTQDALSSFETWFVLAMLHFANTKVAIAVVECGLGGEFDATNAIANAAYDVFTHIDYDHVGLLGDTIEAIAKTKARIIRPQAQVIDYAQQLPAVQQIIMAEAKAKKAVYHSAADVTLSVQDSDLHGSDLHIQTPWSFDMHLGLAGHFQQQNLRTVLKFVQCYNDHPLKQTITPDLIQRTLSGLTFKGRLQQVHTNPPVFADGGHNPDAMREIHEVLLPYAKKRPLILVLGFLKDKNVAANLQALADLPAEVIATTPNHPQRALAAEALGQLMQTTWPNRQIQVIADPNDAIAEAMQRAGEQTQAIVVVAGSFYLVKEVTTGVF